MVWEPEISELNYRRQLAEQLGGKEAVERQHSKGKLTVRERIAALADPASFQEIGNLAGSVIYSNDNKITSFTPANLVTGVCTIDGRKVVIDGGDFTVRGGAADAAIGNKRQNALELSEEWRLPYIRLLDATGGSVRTFEKIGYTYVSDTPETPIAARLLSKVPVVSAVLGSVAGLPAVESCLAHYNVMIKGTSQVFPGGPPVVKAALGYDITKEELGDERTQVSEAGVIENLAENEIQAFKMIKRFLSYMPNNVWELPKRILTGDDPKRRDNELISIMPRDRRKGYDAHAVLKHVLDRDSIFEICPLYGQSRITALARVNGYPIGVMINNPKHLGGAMDVAAGNKVVRFLMLCNTFHLPIVWFVSEPGFMVGLEEQKKGIVRAGARICCTTYSTQVPYISFIIGQCYGVAAMIHNRHSGMCKRYAWPSANWGSMHIEGGVTAAYRHEIENSPNPQKKRKEIEERMQTLASPFRTAEAFNIEDIIDPRDTRPLLCDFIEIAQPILKSQLGVTSSISYLP